MWKHACRMLYCIEAFFERITEKSMSYVSYIFGNNPIKNLVIKFFFFLYTQDTPPRSLDRRVKREYSDIVDRMSQEHAERLSPISVTELGKVMKKMNNKKSSRYGQILNHMIELLSPSYLR